MPAAPAIGLRAGLLAAVLAAIEHVETRQLAVIQRAVDAHVGTMRAMPGPQREMFVKGAIGGSAPCQEGVDRNRRVLRPAVGVIVLYLVVVPGRHAGTAGMQRLQVRVGAVEGVAVAVASQIQALAAAVRAYDLVRRCAVVAVLVDVIAQEEHQVRLLRGEVAVRAEIPQLPVRAGDKAEPRRVRHLMRCRQATRATDLAARAQCLKAVPVRAIGRQTGQLHVHRMAPGGAGNGLALAHDGAHLRVAGHLPTHRHRCAQSTASVRVQRAGCQPRPDHKAIGQRIAGRHPQRERVGSTAGACEGAQQPGRGQTGASDEDAPAARIRWSQSGNGIGQG